MDTLDETIHLNDGKGGIKGGIKGGGRS